MPMPKFVTMFMTMFVTMFVTMFNRMYNSSMCLYVAIVTSEATLCITRRFVPAAAAVDNDDQCYFSCCSARTPLLPPPLPEPDTGLLTLPAPHTHRYVRLHTLGAPIKQRLHLAVSTHNANNTIHNAIIVVMTLACHMAQVPAAAYDVIRQHRYHCNLIT